MCIRGRLDVGARAGLARRSISSDPRIRMKRSYVTLVLRLSRRWVNEICAGDYRFDGRVSRAGIPDAGDREIRFRIGVWRVLNQLNESGQIMIQKRKENGAASRYSWRH